MPAFTLPTNLASVEGFIGAMYGYAIGSATMTQVNADIVSYGGLNNTLNAYYTAGFGSQTTASVAASIVANLGIVAGQNGLAAADVTQATLYVTGVLNATAANARGAAVLGIVNLFNGLAGTTGTLANFSNAATAWTNNQASAVQYAGSNTTDSTLTAAVTTVAQANAANAAAAAAALAAGKTFSLTTGTDVLVGSGSTLTSLNNFSGTGNASTATFTAGDSITGGGAGTNNVLTVSDAATSTGGTWTPTSLPATISGIQTANFTSGNNGITANTSSTNTAITGLTSLTQLNVTDVGASSITAAPTTSVSLNASSVGTSNTSISGGLNISATLSGVTNSAGGTTGTISMGSSTTAGTNTLTSAISASTNQSSTGGAISMTGGTVQSVTQTVANGSSVTSLTTAVAPFVNTAGPITVTGTSSTTSVTVVDPTPVAPTVTVTVPSLAAGSTYTITTSTGNTYAVTYTNSVASNAGTTNAGTVSASQVAAALAGSTAVPGLTVATTGTPSAAWTVGAVSGSTVVLTAVISGGVVPLTPTVSGGTMSGTGGALSNNITINDVNQVSTVLPSTITSVSLSGLNGGGTYSINTNALANTGSGGLTLNNVTGTTTVTLTNNLTTQATGAGTLAVSLNNDTGTLTFSDANNELTGLAITAGALPAAGSANSFNGSFIKVTSISVAGNSAVNLGSVTGDTVLASVTQSGNAGLVVGTTTANPLSALKTITSSSSGNTVAYLGTTNVTFSSTGSGNVSVGIAGPRTSSVTVGTGASNELIWTSTSSVPSALLGSGGTISGFNQFAIGPNAAAGSYNMANLVQTSGSFTSLAVQTAGTAVSSNYTFTNVTPGTTLNLDPLLTGTITYTTTGTTGSSNSATVNMGLSSTNTRVSLGLVSATSTVTTAYGTLAFNDASTSPNQTNGVGTVNIATNSTAAGQVYTATNFNDVGLTTLNISGTAGFVAANIANTTTSTLTINDTHSGTGITSFGTITNANLTSLTLSGTGTMGATTTATGTGASNITAVIGTLALTSSPTLTLTNNSTTGTSVFTVGTITDTALSSLTFAGSRNSIVNSYITDQASSLTISNNGTSTTASTVGTLTDTSLQTLSFGGVAPITVTTLSPTTTANGTLTLIDSDTGAVTVSNLLSTTLQNETIINNGTAAFTVGPNNYSPNLATLSLIGPVAYSQAGVSLAATTSGSNFTLGTALTSTSTLVTGAGIYNSSGLFLGTVAGGGTAGQPITSGTSITNTAASYYSSALATSTITFAGNDTTLSGTSAVSAASDNSTISLWLGQNNNNLTITLGNGATDRIVDDGTGQLTATFGTGAGDIVNPPSGASTITFGSHTSTDYVNLVNVSTTPNLLTLKGFNLSSSTSTFGDVLNLSLGGFGVNSTNNATTVLYQGNGSATGVVVTDGSSLIGTSPTIAAFPTVSGTLPAGQIYSLGSTVYNASSLVSFLNTTNVAIANGGSTSVSVEIPLLVTFGDGVHLELLRLPSNVSSTLNNVQASGVFDMVDFVGSTMSSVPSAMANSFAFIA